MDWIKHGSNSKYWNSSLVHIVNEFNIFIYFCSKFKHAFELNQIIRSLNKFISFNFLNRLELPSAIIENFLRDSYTITSKISFFYIVLLPMGFYFSRLNYKYHFTWLTI